jgi:hypothetical protein
LKGPLGSHFALKSESVSITKTGVMSALNVAGEVTWIYLFISYPWIIIHDIGQVITLPSRLQYNKTIIIIQ